MPCACCGRARCLPGLPAPWCTTLPALHPPVLGARCPPVPAVVPPAYACLDPDMSLSLGQTMALIFPPDDPKGAPAAATVA